jgi:hypothetical protein
LQKPGLSQNFSKHAVLKFGLNSDGERVAESFEERVRIHASFENKIF